MVSLKFLYESGNEYNNKRAWSLETIIISRFSKSLIIEINSLIWDLRDEHSTMRRPWRRCCRTIWLAKDLVKYNFSNLAYKAAEVFFDRTCYKTSFDRLNWITERALSSKLSQSSSLMAVGFLASPVVASSNHSELEWQSSELDVGWNCCFHKIFQYQTSLSKSQSNKMTLNSSYTNLLEINLDRDRIIYWLSNN